MVALLLFATWQTVAAATGSVAVTNGGMGIYITGDADNNIIGTDGNNSSDTAERNVISGNYGWGIRVYSGGSGTVIAGNYIGVDVAGNGALGNSISGVYLNSATDVMVGGTQPAQQNIIAYNSGDGVTIGSDPASVTETDNLGRSNAIYANTGLGIDLGNDGVTANDSGDGDPGSTKLVFTVSLSAAAETMITGTILNDDNADYIIYVPLILR